MGTAEAVETDRLRRADPGRQQQDLVDQAPAPSAKRLGSLEGPSRLHLLGTASVRRIGRWRFPVFELAQDGDVLAVMGRYGWFNIFFGSGQRIELTNGNRWRIPSVGVAGNICPRVVDADGRKVAVGALGFGNYGINGRDYGYVLYAAEPRRFGRANRWILRHHEDDLAVVNRWPLSIEASQPVPLGAVFLCFVLARYGIPGELGPTVPKFHWG
jgi:hypothetical protein